MATANELLVKGLDLIKTHGWGRTFYIDVDGCYCSVGALRFAAFGQTACDERDPEYVEYVRATGALAEAIAGADAWIDGTDPYDVESVVTAFNDDGGTSQADVERAYRAAIVATAPTVHVNRCDHGTAGCE